MKSPKAVFVCQECGAQAPKWMGRCNECGAWNSLVEERVSDAAPAAAGTSRYAQFSTTSSAKLYAEVETAQGVRLSTGIDEFDRVLGGGVVPGSLVLLGGEPGIGKSTLLCRPPRTSRARSGQCSMPRVKSRSIRSRVAVIAWASEPRRCICSRKPASSAFSKKSLV
jgi:DNA repair protein RadA/Sms